MPPFAPSEGVVWPRKLRVNRLGPTGRAQSDMLLLRRRPSNSSNRTKMA